MSIFSTSPPSSGHLRALCGQHIAEMGCWLWRVTDEADGHAVAPANLILGGRYIQGEADASISMKAIALCIAKYMCH